ncbi:dihydrofolate reductase family protein [Pelagicoccus mobilis]|uniref:Dihydrofolate reductase n=1 Tax=Pelagicoccus mobilis TaxID=415221 RepID=A0A934S1I8_9BACT|nr:dihydrofolate reductase family protein [Pelagicoccus mobilis]MBK1878896.1 dihydrofolate reductase [Pelagicoccus mobilis]
MLTLIAAQSLDGYIARPGQSGTDFCSESDAQFLRSALKDFDSLIMGRKTYDTLRQRILNSDTTRYLRKIVTRDPGNHASDHRPELIEFTDQPPSEILAELTQRGRHRTALLGGGEIYTAFLKAGLVDELWLTLEPMLFGGGTPIFSAPHEIAFELKETRPLSQNTLLLKYR